MNNSALIMVINKIIRRLPVVLRGGQPPLRAPLGSTPVQAFRQTDDGATFHVKLV
jgi:hypothetical protein